MRGKKNQTPVLRYFDRDMSWLSFNYRVLLEAADEQLPIYERISFIAIYTSNLEEFYKVRVAEHRAVAKGLKEAEDTDRDKAIALLGQITAETTRQLAERTRIAREMHDTLAHRLSLISMHAGALEYRGDLDRDTIQATAGVLRDTAQKAARELRTVLSVLREETADTSPQPTVHSIPALVETVRAAGTDVTLHLDPPLQSAAADSLDDSTSRHLYRVVQEGLTNAQKHAPGMPVTVRLTGAPGRGITVTISNPVSASVPPASDGLGLVGLAERARLANGSFESGVRRGVYTTQVQVPW